MSNLVFQDTSYVSSRNDLPVVQNISDVLVSTRYEKDAYAHWAFYGNEPLKDKVNSRSLTLQAGAAIPPSYSSLGVALTNAKGSALISDLIDNASTNITVILVAKADGTGLYLMGMTLPTTGSTTESGFGAYVSSNKAYVNVKPLIAASRGGVSNLSTNQTFDQTTPFLVAVSIDKVKKTVLLYSFKDGIDGQVSSSFLSTYENANKAIAVGNAYYTASESGFRTTFTEAILYNKALTLNEIKAVAKRCQARLAARGITI
ncbi:hypothetical protein Q4372_16915 [Acinetobacter baumannii]